MREVILLFLLLHCLHITSVLAAETPDPVAPIPVTAKSFKEVAVYPRVTVPATVVSMNNAEVSAEVSAVIVSIPVEVGQVVKRGTILFELESEYYQLEHERAVAMLTSLDARITLAKYQLQRAQSLSRQNAVSEELLKQRESELASLKAERAAQQAAVNIAHRNLDKCRVKSPFRAVIKARLGSVGELAATGSPVLQIIDTEHLEVSAKVQAGDLSSLGTAAQLEFDSQGDAFSLAVKHVTPAYDQHERSQEVRFRFLEKEALPGEFGSVSWQKRNPHVPSDVMVRRDGRLGVFVVRGDAAVFVPLPKATEGQPAEAGADIDANAKIVDDGRFRLQHGSPVVVN